MFSFIKFHKFILSLLYFSLISLILQSQIIIEGKITGLSNIDISVVAYNGDNILNIGEVKLNSKGEFSFKTKKKQPNGIYTLYAQNLFQLDFIYLGKAIELNTNAEKPASNAEFPSSKENVLYHEFYKSRNQYIALLSYIKQNTELENIPDSIIHRLIETASNNFVASTQTILKQTNNLQLKNIINAIAYPTPLIEQHDTSLYQKFKKLVFIQMLADTNNLNTTHLYNTPFLAYKFNLLYYDLLQNESNSTIKNISSNILISITNTEIKLYYIKFLTNYFKQTENIELLAWLSNTIQLEQQFSEQINKIQLSIKTIEKLQIGSIFPQHNFINIKSDSISISTIHSKHKIIIFWSSDCPHCTELLRTINKYYPELKKKGIEIVAISLDESKLHWAEFLMLTKYTWINLNDKTAYFDGLLEKYQITYTPKIYIIDNENRIIYKPKDKNQLLIWVNK